MSTVDAWHYSRPVRYKALTKTNPVPDLIDLLRKEKKTISKCEQI